MLKFIRTSRKLEMENRRQPKMPRKRGRPAQKQNMSDDILNAAERLFAEAGYESVSQRQVAAEAQIDQALINYHFGSKEGLYKAVIKRYSKDIVDKWEKGLREIEADESNIDIKEVITSYVSPFFDYRRQPDLLVLKLQARLHAETSPFFLEIRRDLFDEASRKYIKYLIKALPDADPADIAWRFVFTIGAFLFVGPGTDRLDDLSDGAYRVETPEEAVSRLISFLVGGFSAPPTYPHSVPQVPR